VTEFDLLQSPLAGVNLIEASAGSGKTYTISRIFLRLLMERHFTVERILVVTFTEAATKELRGRIRAMLAAARQALSGVEPEDPILGKLAARYSRSDSMKRWLESALRGFDEAAIYTIHGFCRRVLHENAFESAALFETELITEQEAIFQEVVDDFWRRTVDSESLLFCSFLRRELPLESLAALLRSHVSKPFLRIIPEEDGKLGAGGTVAAAEADYLESQRRLLAEWASHGGEILELMRRTRGLDRRRYSERTLEKIAAVMDGL